MGGTPSPPRSVVGVEVIAALVRCALATPPGAFVEVGVYQGGTAWHLAEAAESQGRPLFLYDTFAGIPFKGVLDSHQVGDFNDCSADVVRRCIPYARVIEGVFPFTALEMGPIAFCHLDVDQEQSYRQALEYLGGRMVKGGVIWCDDVPCLAGASRAVSEFAARTHLQVVTPETTGKSMILF